MTISRILGAIGRTFISTGVIILMFVAYQLWGTGLQHSRAQDQLDSEFANAQQEAEDLGIEIVETTRVVDADDTESEADEVIETVRTLDLTEAQLDLVFRDQGEAMARINIPRIGLTQNVVAGVSVEDLRKGPGHYSNTPLPGMEGNAAIAGHRTTYGAPFHRIDELQPGDEIIVETPTLGTFTYRVLPHQSDSGETIGHFIVDPSAIEVLNDYGDNRLTLTACHPKFSARQRIIVQAVLVDVPVVINAPNLPELGEATLATEYENVPDSEAAGDPSDIAAAAEADAGDDAAADDATAEDPDAELAADGDEADASTSDDEAGAVPISTNPFNIDDGSQNFGEGLSGDRDAIPPAISWMLAAVMIWITAAFVATKWRRWPAYGIGILPFFAVLFIAFVHIDQALPSY